MAGRATFPAPEVPVNAKFASGRILPAVMAVEAGNGIGAPQYR